ncbi:MAG: hypothetical protein ACYC3X_29160 [Pirellulaceae bacterium]
MSNIRRQWSAIAILLCFYLVPAAVAHESQIFEIGGGITFSGTNQRSVSHGHAYLVPGAPGFVFGCVEDTNRQMKLSYLVLIKHGATATTTFERGNPDPAISSDSSDGKIRLINFNERIRFGKSNLAFSYKAEFDAVKDQLISEEMTFQGKRLDLTDGRVIVVDMTAEPVEFQQVNVKLPSNPNLDFINSTSEYKLNTNRWLEEITKNSEVVAKTFEQ